MASRRRRRKSLGGVVTNVESRVRRIEKRPGSKRLKTNVVSTEKIQPRAVVTKVIAQDAVTPNEAAFGTTFVTDTQPTEFLKEGTTWLDPNTGSTQIYSMDTSSFIEVTDATARASADGKNTIYRQTSQPTGGTYVTGDTWFDSDDNNKIYRYNGTTWVAVQLGGNGLANINANSITTGTIDASVITVSNLDAGNITTGSLSATRIGAGTISASVEMTSATITGGTIRTSSSGSRVELTSSDYMKLYDSSGVVTGVITPWQGAASGGPSGSFGVSIKGSETDEFPRLYVEGDAASGILLMQTHYSGIIVQDTSVSLSAGTTFSPDYSLTVDTLGAYMTPSTAYGTQGLRNIRAVSSFTASTDTSGGVGDVILVYTP